MSCSDRGSGDGARWDVEEEAKTLVAYIDSLDDFEVLEALTYRHMGALLTDAILQAGVNYDSVVKPRVEDLISNRPDANETTPFLELLKAYGPQEVLRFKPSRKPQTLEDLCDLLARENVETVDQLKDWIERTDSRSKLLAVYGIGPKTVSYIGILCGLLDEVAIDIHLRRFLSQADIAFESDGHAQQIFIKAANLADITPANLDHRVWAYMTKRARQRAAGRRPKQCDHPQGHREDAT